ncbi:alpha/beta-type small acid-soluble spore protein [Clostridium saccharobutylicum]|uniref:Small, acid-soluble spore protein, alpha/beta type n=1 Tax=Clostridium saccharobutylicum DSM 13864 TaxID=1345695 RepID=U5MQG6_CLOSA|nr:alpha/beta-type small acid-soluble spore protein [Clostridium saccharobutylicum]AGX42768.1 small, acid-soluble spore protein, alpha/beta type [Clostridium saccharobutylicum DSM 13864]AQR90064.1 small, acid-soluble spore protein C2 [Clostridium saccharobutylicum]AQR99969.1 small, acid-soluble spore protein C2 [Clostridium saccharobutylicum]AQS09754.1 small, acid-soluble spore protein C2 [Clostridium saccharobutylicum]AQS13953.1 small, acid-soluble spore protein C2 [Clostridium saccharobutyli
MTRRPLVPEAKKGLDKLKNEFENEFGIEINDSYKRNKTSRLNGHIGGSIGGLMTKKMIESYEKSLIDK